MTTLQASSQNQLRQFIEQIERLEEEKRGLGEDIRDKFAEAKAIGFDVKAMREVLKLRKKSKTDRDEHQAIVETYMHALGMLADTPLGEAAIKAATGGYETTISINGGPAHPMSVVREAVDLVRGKRSTKEAEAEAARRRADKYIPA